MKKIIACIFLTGFVSACGWHLRGSTDLPQDLSSLYVSAEDAHGPMITVIKRLLEANNVMVADSTSEAPYALVIVEERNDRRTAGVGSDALTSAYEITLAVDYEIRSRQNEPLAPMTTAITSRTYNYNPGNASSSEQEEATLLREMRREVALQMLRRLQTVTAAQENLPVESQIIDEPTTTGAPDGQAAP